MYKSPIKFKLSFNFQAHIRGRIKASDHLDSSKPYDTWAKGLPSLCPANIYADADGQLESGGKRHLYLKRQCKNTAKAAMAGRAWEI